jgi:WD40 repeat protein
MYEGNRPYGVTEITISLDNQWMATYCGGYIQIWSISEQRLFSNFSGVGTSLAFSPDSNLLAAGSYDGSIHVYQVPSGEEVAVLHGHIGAIYDLIFTNDGTTLLSISEDGSIRLWGIDE